MAQYYLSMLRHEDLAQVYINVIIVKYTFITDTYLSNALRREDLAQLIVKYPFLTDTMHKTMYEFDSFGEDDEDICSLQGSFTSVRHVRKFNKIRVFCNFVCIQSLNHFRHSRTVTPDIVAFLKELKQEMRDSISWERKIHGDFTCKIMYQIAYCQYTMARRQ